MKDCQDQLLPGPLHAELLALRATKERFECALRGANDGIWDWALDTGEIYWSPRLLELLGYESLATNFEAIIALLHPDDRDGTRAAIRRALHEGEPYRIDHRIRTGDRAYRWFRSRGQSLRAADGRPTRFAGSITDIHEQKQAEAIHRRSQYAYERLFQTSREAMVVTAIDGRIEEANPPFQALVGYELHELRQLRYQDLTPDAWREDDERASTQIEASGYAEPYEKEYRRKDGSRVPIEIRVWRVEGETAQYFGLIRERCTSPGARSTPSERENRLRTMGDSLPARIAFVDRDDRYQYANRLYRDYYGIGEEGIAGRHLREVLGNAVYEEVAPYIASALAGTPVSFERNERDASGRTRYLQISYAPFSPDGVTVEGFYALITDVSEQKRVAEALEASERRFRSLCAGSPAAVFEADAEGNVVYVNRRWEELTGLTLEELLGQGWVRAICPDDLGRVMQCWSEALDAGSEFADEFRLRNRNGDETRWIATQSKPIRDEFDQLVGHVGMGIDVSERRRAEADLRESLEMLQTMADSLPVLIAFVGPDQRYRFNNIVYETWYGRSRSEITGRTVREVIGEASYCALQEKIESALAGTAHRAEVELAYPDGRPRFADVTFTPQRDPAGKVKGYWVLAHDITERKVDQDRIRTLAYYDALTGLPNRQYFQAELSRTIGAQQVGGAPVALVFVDLDRFKNVNDTLGHEGGDRLLVQVAARLEAVARSFGLFDSAQTQLPVARFGGDEFTLLVDRVESEERVDAVTDAIMGLLAEPFEIDGRSVEVTATVGVSYYPRDANSASDLLRHADSAMYEGKRTGRARTVGYSRAMGQRNLRRLEIEARLRDALRENQFGIAYQVQRRARGGRITGAEALLRWSHPELGVISPTEFISVAEETGLVVPIGEWVLEQVALQVVKWDEAGFAPLRVGVNVSARQLRDATVAERFREILARCRVSAERFEIEITESALIDDQGTVASVIEALRGSGFQIALDDFGTGYSSLSYLRRFPIDRLKIDRSFVAGIPRNRADCELTAAVIAMAHNLRLKVVAEGVESRIQADFLTQQGCDDLQGFLLGHAEPAHKFERHLEIEKPENEVY